MVAFCALKLPLNSSILPIRRTTELLRRLFCRQPLLQVKAREGRSGRHEAQTEFRFLQEPRQEAKNFLQAQEHQFSCAKQTPERCFCLRAFQAKRRGALLHSLRPRVECF